MVDWYGKVLVGMRDRFEVNLTCSPTYIKVKTPVPQPATTHVECIALICRK